MLSVSATGPLCSYNRSVVTTCSYERYSFHSNLPAVSTPKDLLDALRLSHQSQLASRGHMTTRDLLHQSKVALPKVDTALRESPICPSCYVCHVDSTWLHQSGKIRIRKIATWESRPCICHQLVWNLEITMAYSFRTRPCRVMSFFAISSHQSNISIALNRVAVQVWN